MISLQEPHTVPLGPLMSTSSPSSSPTVILPSLAMKRQSKRNFMHCLAQAAFTVVRHISKHWGVGVVCAVAYFDPGNWAVDLQAGSQFGYRLLFVVVLSVVFAIFFQILAGRLGCVTGLDLATHCRLLLHSRPKHNHLYRYLGFYPLYLFSELAIIVTDLSELLGSAIAFTLLFPKLKIWHGVVITAADVLFLLAFRDPLRQRPVKAFEYLVAILVLIVLVCMAIILSRLGIDWRAAFEGFVPSRYIFSSGALYTSVGIIGATVQPHSLFLGSALATQDRLELLPYTVDDSEKSESDLTEETDASISSGDPPQTPPRGPITRLKASIRASFRAPPPSANSTTAKSHAGHENRPFAFVKAHIRHGMSDLVINLMILATCINSMILIVASAVFFYGPQSSEWQKNGADLFDAFNIIGKVIGKWAAILFAIALLAAGESASLIATVAGQAVSEGFLRWRVPLLLRRVFTRLLAIVPSTIVAVIGGRTGISTLLVVTQVMLAVVLPFIIVPLLYLTSSKSVMSVRRRRQGDETSGDQDTPQETENTNMDEYEMVDFSNGRIVTLLGSLMCAVIIVANVYVMVTLGLHR